MRLGQLLANVARVCKTRPPWLKSQVQFLSTALMVWLIVLVPVLWILFLLIPKRNVQKHFRGYVPPSTYSGVVHWLDGSKFWYLNGKLHREDGPAIERVSGIKEWFLNGERHREDGPAYEGANGTKEWFLNGQLHREDGPAVELSEGYKSWWLDNHCFLCSEDIDTLEGNYIVIERGIPTDIMFGKLKLTKTQLLTVEGTVFVWDNLPGLEIGEGNE